MDPTDLMRLPRSEYLKRRLYYFEWRKANEKTSYEEEIAPGVTSSGNWDD